MISPGTCTENSVDEIHATSCALSLSLSLSLSPSPGSKALHTILRLRLCHCYHQVRFLILFQHQKYLISMDYNICRKITKTKNRLAKDTYVAEQCNKVNDQTCSQPKNYLHTWMGSLLKGSFWQNAKKAWNLVKKSLDFKKITFIESNVVMDWFGIDHNTKYSGQNDYLDTCTFTRHILQWTRLEI